MSFSIEIAYWQKKVCWAGPKNVQRLKVHFKDDIAKDWKFISRLKFVSMKKNFISRMI